MLEEDTGVGVDVGEGVLGLAVLGEDAGRDLVDLANELEHGVVGHLLCKGEKQLLANISKGSFSLQAWDLGLETYPGRRCAGPCSGGQSCGGRRGRSRARRGQS